jgi:hypothetical protein
MARFWRAVSFTELDEIGQSEEIMLFPPSKLA